MISFYNSEIFIIIIHWFFYYNYFFNHAMELLKITMLLKTLQSLWAYKKIINVIINYKYFCPNDPVWFLLRGW
jgi:hypothetical protein